MSALLPVYAGRIKCIYIDPPYNTRSAFEQYDANLEHSSWLAMMWPRLELLRELLAEDRSIWVSIDDNEAHYLKVVMDEVFGRSRFIASYVWQKRYSRDNRGAIGDAREYVVVYAKSPESLRKSRNRVLLNENPSEDLQESREPEGTGSSQAMAWPADDGAGLSVQSDVSDPMALWKGVPPSERPVLVDDRVRVRKLWRGLHSWDTRSVAYAYRRVQAEHEVLMRNADRFLQDHDHGPTR